MGSNTEDSKTSTGVEYCPDTIREPQAVMQQPSVIKGDPTSLGVSCFALAFTTLSVSLMELRGLKLPNAFVGNCMFTAGMGQFVVAQWSLVLGNNLIHTILGAFGLWNLAYGAILIPYFGVQAAFGDDVAQFNNAVGFFMLVWAILCLFLTVACVSVNVVFTSILIMTHLAFDVIAASYFALADGNLNGAYNLKVAGGALGFAVGMQAWYVLAHLMCQDTIFFFSFPLGDTSAFFARLKSKQRK